MNVDAYTLIAIDFTGEKGRIMSYEANNIELKDYLSDFVDDKVDSLIDMKEVVKINPDIHNCLLLVTFSFRSVSSFNGEHTEFDEFTTVRDVLVLDHNYKETWRKNLTTMYHSIPLETINDSENDSEAVEDISDWEEFYDEAFTFFKPKDINPLALIGLNLDK